MPAPGFDRDPDATVVRPRNDPDATVVRARLDVHPDADVTKTHPRSRTDATKVRPRLGGDATVVRADDDATIVRGAGARPALPPPAALALSPGFRLLEYRIDRVLGQGGFGITYLATDVNLNASVAIKEYLPEEIAFRTGDRSVSPNASHHRDRYRMGLESFLIEARTLASFRHPSIVRVARFFEAHRTAYMVLEYEKGAPFKSWWPQNAALGEVGLVELLLPLLDGLAVVHAGGFLHRDIKPDNIQVRDDGTLVLLDFGSAGQTVAAVDPGAVVVTPGYAPIEQYGLGEQGPWTDLYALSATLYWAVAGKKPPDVESRMSDPQSFVPAVEVGRGRFGTAFLEAIDWGLKINPDERPRDVAQFRRAICADHLTSVNLQDALRIGDTIIEGEDHLPIHVRLYTRVRRFFQTLVHPTQWPLAAKMTLAMLCTSLLPMLVVGAYNLRVSQVAIASGESRYVEQLAASTAGRVSQFITDNRHLARSLGSDSDFPAVLTRPDAAAQGPAVLGDKLVRIVQANPDIQRITLVDAAGNAIASSQADITGRSYTGEHYFQEALQGRSTATSLILGNLGSASSMVLAEPVSAADGKVLGVLVLRIRGSSIAAIVDEVRNDSALTPFLIDRDGVILHHLQEDLIYRSLAPLPDSVQAALRADQRFHRDQVESLGETELGQAMVGAQGTGHVAYRSVVNKREEIAGFAPVAAHQWVVGVSESRTDFEAPLTRLMQQLMWSGAVVGLLFTVLALRFARGIVRPVRALTNAADALKAGDYDAASVKVERRDELGQLARTFNVMIDVLRQRERERDRKL